MEIVSFAGAHLDGVLCVLEAALVADPIPRALFVRKVLLDPNFDPAGAPVALEENRVIGFGLSLARRVPLEGLMPDAGRGYVTLLAVASEAQRKGVGARLLQAMEDYLRGRGCTKVLLSPYAPNYFTPGVDVNACANGLRFFTRHGYAELYRPLAMDCNLLTLRTPEWVRAREEALRREGVTVEAYRAELIPALMAFLNAEFPGDWMRFAREAITRIEQGDPPTRVWLAHEKGAVIGFSHHEGARFGPIGVSQAQRGRGVGQALMYRTLHAMRAQGLHNAWFMWSDDATAARIYAEAGFVESRRFAVLQKEIGQ